MTEQEFMSFYAKLEACNSRKLECEDSCNPATCDIGWCMDCRRAIRARAKAQQRNADSPLGKVISLKGHTLHQDFSRGKKPTGRRHP